MPRAAFVVAIALLGNVAAIAAPTGAAEGDPLQAPECREALAALQAHEDAAASAPAARIEGGAARPIEPKLAALRRRAARNCLASRADPPLPRQARATADSSCRRSRASARRCRRRRRSRAAVAAGRPRRR